MKIYKLPILIILLGLLSFYLQSACSRQEEGAAQSTTKPEKVVPVTIEPVVLTDLTETFTLPASLEAWEDLSLAAEIAGSVQKIHFKEGDRIQAHEILLEIDPETIKNYLHRDQQNVELISRKFKRYQKLEAEGLVSTQELDDLQNGLTAAKAALQTTKLQLEKSFPRAPVSGIVDRLYVDRGEYVDPGKPLLRLVQVKKLKVIGSIHNKKAAVE
ncbi:MAG: efflux RND transporter periplasmic adaptor subunit [Desulfuromusa sp.]|nr:efflux RND transporter periplasmic adaptor subunit [Desulfuromusa sp.]